MDLRGSWEVMRSWGTMLCLVAIATAGTLTTSTSARADQPPAKADPDASGKTTPANRELELRGRMVRLASASGGAHKDNPSHPEQVWGFRTADGTIYHLVRNRFSEAVLTDSRVRKQDLLLKGIVHPDTQQFEVERTFSIRNGAVYDVYYYCSVCHIETVSPGPCECCQGPVELKEKRLRRDQP